MLLVFCLIVVVGFCESNDIPKPLVMAHYMTWFEYTDNIRHWPSNEGTYYNPLIGYYDSHNETVMDWQLSLMEKAGINGIMAYWNGVENKNNYPFEKATTDIIWSKIKSKYPKMKLGISYDFTSHITNISIFDDSMNYLKQNYFNHPQYITYTDDNPIMLIFGSHNSMVSLQTPDGIEKALKDLNLSHLYFYVNYRSGSFSWSNNDYKNLGVYNWVYPNDKSENKDSQISEVIDDNNKYYEKASGEPYNSKFYIGSLHHGFSDHYESDGTETTKPYNKDGFINLDYGYIEILYNDTYNNGTKYPYMIQIPTWNDYTEGTMIEPNIPTKGCTKGCADDTESNPYQDLVSLYLLFVDNKADPNQVQKEFEDITKTFFPNLLCTR